MGYTQYTQASFTTELAQSLNDSSHVYWSQDELNRALNEALLCWGALTSYWTARGQFPTVTGSAFYDLSTQLPVLRSRSYTFDQLTTEIQYHLLEFPGGVSGIGMTDQFTIGQITAALARRRNQFVIDSRIPLTYGAFNVGVGPPAGLVQLDQSIALIQRAAWQDGIGKISPLRRTDPFGAQSYNPLWNLSPGTPWGYSQAEAMPDQLQLSPPPLSSGQILLTYAQTLNLAIVGGTSFAVPDEFAWAIKYGAMEEIMASNSQGYDPIRARYCNERYQGALEVAQLQRTLLRVSSNDKPLPVGTLAAMDSGKPSWQTIPGAPQSAVLSYDLVGFYKVPNAAYSITCDVAQSAPLPTGGASTINVGREELPYIFDYCRHILMVKIGGTEFVQSMPLYDNFLKGAAQRNKLLQVKARYLTPLFTVAKEQESTTHAA